MQVFAAEPTFFGIPHSLEHLYFQILCAPCHVATIEQKKIDKTSRCDCCIHVQLHAPCPVPHCVGNALRAWQYPQSRHARPERNVSKPHLKMLRTNSAQPSSVTCQSLCRCFAKYLEVKVRVADARAHQTIFSDTISSTPQQQPTNLLPWVRDCVKYCDATGTAVSNAAAKADLLRNLDDSIFFNRQYSTCITGRIAEGARCVRTAWLHCVRALQVRPALCACWLQARAVLASATS